MHTLAIRKEGPIANAAALHHRSVAVTAAARFGDVGAVDGRFGIGRLKDRRHVAISGVTIDAGCGPHSALNTAGVKTAIVSNMRISVKLGAAEVRQSSAGRMTPLTFKNWSRGGRW